MQRLGYRIQTHTNEETQKKHFHQQSWLDYATQICTNILQRQMKLKLQGKLNWGMQRRKHILAVKGRSKEDICCNSPENRLQPSMPGIANIMTERQSNIWFTGVLSNTQLFEAVYKPVQKVTVPLVYSAASLPWVLHLVFPPDSQSGLNSDQSFLDPYRVSRRPPASSMHLKLKRTEYERQLDSLKSQIDLSMQGRVFIFVNSTDCAYPVKLQLTNIIPCTLLLHNHKINTARKEVTGPLLSLL